MQELNVPTNSDLVIKGLQELMRRAGPIFCEASALTATLRAAGDFQSLFGYAINGCKYAHRALCEQAGLHIDRDEKLPGFVKEYACGVLLGLYPRKGSKGEDGARDIGRNFFIAYLVERTRLRGYDAKRGGTEDHPSASYMVSKAARGVNVKGMKMPAERRVHQIWEEHSGSDCDFDLDRILAAFEADKERLNVSRRFT